MCMNSNLCHPLNVLRDAYIPLDNLDAKVRDTDRAVFSAKKKEFTKLTMDCFCRDVMLQHYQYLVGRV
jgi:hypothetical protein